MGFLELGQEPGVYSRVTAGMSIRNWSCSVKSGHMSMYQGYLRNINNAWQDNTDASGRLVGVQVFFSSSHSDIGILINFHEESGIITF